MVDRRRSLASTAAPPAARMDHGRVLERADTVLWTIASPGAVLHNFAQRLFIELDEIGYAAWSYLDGARTVDEVLQLCLRSDVAGTDPAAEASRVVALVETLEAYGFIVERVP